MTRVLVLGGAGMLGHKTFQLLGERFESFASFRRVDRRLRAAALFPPQGVIDGVDVRDPVSLARAMDLVRPDVVVNCVGLIKQREDAKQPALADERGARLIHVSTDCVFSGAAGDYRETNVPDATDLYGRTKLLGEVDAPNVLTIRTSMIGRELFHRVSLVEWLISQRGPTVRGFTNAHFSGLTTIALAREIARLISEFPTLHGLYHVGGDPISKHDLLVLLRDAYALDCRIEPDDAFHCDRTLNTERYRAATRFQPPSWPALVAELAADPTPYDTIYT